MLYYALLCSAEPGSALPSPAQPCSPLDPRVTETYHSQRARFLDDGLRQDVDAALLEAPKPKAFGFGQRLPLLKAGKARQQKEQGDELGLREQDERIQSLRADLQGKIRWLQLKVERRDQAEARELDLLLHAVNQRMRFIHGLEKRKQRLQAAVKTMKEEGLRSLAKFWREGDQREKAAQRAKEESVRDALCNNARAQRDAGEWGDRAEAGGGADSEAETETEGEQETMLSVEEATRKRDGLLDELARTREKLRRARRALSRTEVEKEAISVFSRTPRADKGSSRTTYVRALVLALQRSQDNASLVTWSFSELALLERKTPSLGA